MSNMAVNQKDVLFRNFEFAKLSRSNYNEWKRNMKWFLMGEDLWGYVDGSDVKPEDAEALAVRTRWRKGNQRALYFIGTSISSELQVHVDNVTSAKEAWVSLKDQFQRVSLMQKIRLRKQYYRLEMQFGGDIQEHIQKLCELHNEMKELGEPTDDKDLAMTLLASLPFERYQSLIVSLDVAGEDKINFNNVKALLLNEMDRMAYRATGEQQITAKLATVGVSTKYKGKVKCYICGKRGHIAKHCYSTKKKDGKFLDRNQHNKDAQSACKVVAESGDGPSFALTIGNITSNSNGVWLIDSGATQHMVQDKNLLEDFVLFDKPQEIRLAAKSKPIYCIGEGSLRNIKLEGGQVLVDLEKVLCVPDIADNLLSVHSMTMHGASVVFNGETCNINAGNKVLGVGHKYQRLYGVKVLFPARVCVSCMCVARVCISKSLDDYSMTLWHRRLGHISQNNIVKLQSVAEGIANIKKASPCMSCAQGKQHRDPFPQSYSHASDLLEVVHSDVMAFEVNSIGGSRYICTFIDDKSRYAFVYMLKTKNEVLMRFKDFVEMVETQTGKCVKILRTDNGGEFTSKEFLQFCREKGIQCQYSNPYTPEQNGMAERLNRTLAEEMRAILYHAQLPKQYWAEAISTAAYLKNRSPHSALNGKTPYETWHEKKPNLSHLRVFGCLSTVHVPKQKRTKLDAKALVRIFIGYPDGVKGYRLIDPTTLTITVSRDVIFYEDKFISDIELIKSDPVCYSKDIMCMNLDTTNENDASNITKQDQDYESEPDVNVNEESNIPHSESHRTLQDDLPTVVGKTYEETFMNQVRSLPEKRPSALRPYGNEHCKLADSLVSEINEPTSIKEAWKNEYGLQWKEATDSEIESLNAAQTWDLVPLPEKKNVVGCKWIFKVKRKADNSIDRFKARLVAQGYSQKQGIDFDEVFSPVARFSTIRIVLALSTLLDLDLHQLDVKTAFLNGSLSDEIYMQQPEGYISKENPGYVCKLNRSLYGLRQAARCWNKVIDEYLKVKNYKASSADACIYIKQSNGCFVILSIYVDDILIASNSTSMLEKEKSELGKRFSVTDQGEAHYILGMAIKRDRSRGTMFLSQHNYVENVLKRFRMESCNPVSTPLAAGVKLSKATEAEKSVDTNLYQQIIGCLTYMMTATRPDLSAAVNLLSQYMSSPNKEHWSAVKHILRYLRGTTKHGLCFARNNGQVTLTGYSDSSWGDCVDTRRSTSGYMFLLGGNLITWRTKKQSNVAKSSTEAELVALSQATQECIWLRQLLKDLGFVQEDASIIFEDNQGAITLAKHQKHHDRTKHIAIHDLFCRERVHSGEIDVCYCSTNKMLADIMTKTVPRLQFQEMCSLLGIKNSSH